MEKDVESLSSLGVGRPATNCSSDGQDTASDYERHQAWPLDVTEAIANHFRSSVPVHPRRCLFLGTATGVNDVFPFALGADPRDQILAGDIEPAFLARLRDRAAGLRLRNLEVRRIDITEDMTPLGRFDLVSLLFVIHRLKAWEGVVDRLCNLVAPGGSFFISEFSGPSGLIYLSNERGGTRTDPVSRLVRRYFELLPERFDPPLRSSAIGPVLSLLGSHLRPMGHHDFPWRQTMTPGEMLRRIEARAYAPFFSTHPTRGLLERLRAEFAGESAQPVELEEIIRIYRFERARS